MQSIINSLRICRSGEQMLQLSIVITYATALSRCNRYFPYRSPSKMSKSQQDMSDDSADLLTEISVAYYQDGATHKKYPRSFLYRGPK